MSCFIVPMAQAIATTVCRKYFEKKSSVDSIWKAELPTLEKMLYGGTLVLIVDHIACGEFAMMPKEMLTVGLPMSLVVTAVWGAYVLVKRQRQPQSL